MLTLYYSPGACSLAVHAALVATGATHDLVPTPVRTGTQLTDAYAAVNPRQRVPALVMPQGVLTEAFAILLFLDRLNPDARLFPDGAYARAKAHEWCGWLASTVHPLYRALRRSAYFAEDERAHAPMRETSTRRFLDAMRELDHALQRGGALVGERHGAVDWYAAVFARWAFDYWPEETAPLVHLSAWLMRVGRERAFATALAREGIALLPERVAA